MTPKLEVEQKYRLADVAALEARLRENGFQLAEEQQHEDVYMRHPCRDLRATDEAFRIRTLNEAAWVTYKGPRRGGPVKTRPEIELAIQLSERQQWLEMLQRLGFETLPAVRKRRRIYSSRRREALSDAPPELSTAGLGVTVAVDQVAELGDFAELEIVVAEGAGWEAASEAIQRLGRLLELADVQPRSYLSQLLEKLGIE